VHLGKKLGYIPEYGSGGQWKFLWVVNPPLFEYDEEAKTWVAAHHAFTRPHDEDVLYLQTDPGRVKCHRYDVVLNGFEIGGGSIRLHDPKVQAQFERAVVEAYAGVLRDPVVTVTLKEFEKPYFIAAGEVAHPGKFELRGATTVTQALAIAGGTTKSAKSSQIILFRRFTDELLEVKTIDAKKMLRSRDLSEDARLRPGDTVFVPATVLSQIGAFIAKPALGLYLDPLRQLP